MVDHVLEAILRFGLDKRSLDQVKNGSVSVKDALKQIEQQATRTRERMEKLSDVGMRMTEIGAKVSAVIAVPTALLIRSYTKFADQTESTSRRWIAATRGVEQAQIRVGRVLAQQVVPWMEMGAKVAERMAEAAEKHPGVVGTILGAGAALMGSGSLITLLAQGIKVTADLKLMAAAALMNKAADKMLVAGGEMAAGKTTGGNLLGKAGLIGLTLAGSGYLYNQIARRGAQVGMEIGETLGINPKLPQQLQELQTVLARSGPFSIEMLRQLGLNIKYLGQSSEDTNKTMAISAEMVKLYTQYKEQEKQTAQEYLEQRRQIEEQGEQRRNEIVAQYGQERVRLEEDYERDRAKTIADFNQQQKYAEQDYLRQLAQLRESYEQQEAQAATQYQQQRVELERNLNQQLVQINQEYQEAMQDAAEQHKERLEQLERQHKQNTEDLVAARDALGLAMENQRYKEERQQINEEYREQREEIKQQFQERRAAAQAEYVQQQAELRQNYEQQRAQRQAEYQRQVEEQEAQYAIQQQREQEQFQERLRQMEEQHALEKQQREEQFREQMQQLDRQQRQELADLKRQYELERQLLKQALDEQMKEMLGIQENGYDQMVTATQAYADKLKAIANQLSEQPTSGKQTGGYAAFGRHWLGEAGREYVLNANTTRMAEHMMGGSLSQERLLLALAGRGSTIGAHTGGGMIIESLQITLPGTNMNEQQLGRFMKDRFPGYLAEAFGKARGRLTI